jgi:RecB family endonuclease NucS
MASEIANQHIASATVHVPTGVLGQVVSYDGSGNPVAAELTSVTSDTNAAARLYNYANVGGAL